MGDNKENYIDSVIISSPKPSATSTVMKKGKKKIGEMDNSLGILSISNASSVSGFNLLNDESISKDLEEQRNLALKSLKLAAIPSKYIRPSSKNESSYSCADASSTINESDFLGTSNGRSSSSGFKDSRQSMGQAVSNLSMKLTNPEFTLENFIKEFHQSLNLSGGIEGDSAMFSNSDVKDRMMTDEISWRQKHELPVKNESFSMIADEKMSMTDFFKQRSNAISELKVCVSPKRSKPICLLEERESISSKDNMEEVCRDFVGKVAKQPKNTTYTTPNYSTPTNIRSIRHESNSIKDEQIPSISQIGNLLAQTYTPNRIMNMLLAEPKDAPRDSISEECDLPVSKNSSYTSNYSDNEVMRQIMKQEVPSASEFTNELSSIKTSSVGFPTMSKVYSYNSEESNEAEEKPKVEPQTLENRNLDSNSSRTSSSLSNLVSGKLPLESTKFELTFDCVKVGKSETLDFLLRNKSPKSIRILAKISGNNFKIRKDGFSESEYLPAAKIYLRGNESRQINITFMPTQFGAAHEKLLFTSLDFPEQQSKKECIRLFGYGGTAHVDMYAVPKDLSGKFFLNLGTIDSNVILKKFTVKNNGNLGAFCFFDFSKKHLTTFTNVVIKPTFFCLNAGEEKKVILTYESSTQDQKFLQSCKSLVLEIGTIKMISGSEVNRGRLRNLYKKALEKSKEIKADPFCKVLVEKLEGEIIPHDLNKIKDSPHTLDDIMLMFKYNEIVVTIEQDPEQTLMPQLHDESDLYGSLCHENTVVDNSMYQKNMCKLEPELIILSPPIKTEDSIFLISEYAKIVHFEAQSNPPGLEIIPKEGALSPGQTVILKVKYSKCLSQKQAYKVLVYVDNAVLEVGVKVFFIGKTNLSST